MPQDPRVRSFIERLQRAIDASGLSQNEVGRRVGVSGSRVSNWLTKGAVPSGDAMLRLPDVLEVSAEWLLLGVEPGEETPGAQRARNAETAMAHMALLVSEYRRANREHRELRYPPPESGGIPPAPLKYFRRSDEHEEKTVGPRADDQA